MSKIELKVDTKVSESVRKLSTTLKVLGWICLVVCIIIWIDDGDSWVVGLSGAISSITIIFAGIMVRGLAVITKSAEIHIATSKENYDIKEIIDDEDESE